VAARRVGLFIAGGGGALTIRGWRWRRQQNVGSSGDRRRR